jgi:hypothetical protein
MLRIFEEAGAGAIRLNHKKLYPGAVHADQRRGETPAAARELPEDHALISKQASAE